MNKYMSQALEEAKRGLENHEGGPFGAVIVKDGKIISSSHNTVLKSCDPTAHGEINAIREASKILKTHDLSGCVLYTTAQPCPMCLSTIIWANIKDVYYGTNLLDAEKIGFRDDFIYEYLKGNNNDLINLTNIEHDECLELFKEYSKNNKEIY